MLCLICLLTHHEPIVLLIHKSTQLCWQETKIWICYLKQLNLVKVFKTFPYTLVMLLIKGLKQLRYNLNTDGAGLVWRVFIQAFLFWIWKEFNSIILVVTGGNYKAEIWTLLNFQLHEKEHHDHLHFSIIKLATSKDNYFLYTPSLNQNSYELYDCSCFFHVMNNVIITLSVYV